MAELAIKRPISVFRVVDRGSKLNDPMNILAPSTAKVLACRLDPDDPNIPILSRGVVMALDVTGMDGQNIGRFKRICQHAHVDTLFDQRGKGSYARRTRNEIR